MKRLLFIFMAAAMTACAADPFVIVQIADAQLGFTAAEVSQREGTEYVNDLTYETECLKKAVEMINDMALCQCRQGRDLPDNDQKRKR